MSQEIPVLKFGGRTLQGRQRFGPDEQRLLEECQQADRVNEIYRLLAQRRNVARAQRLREVATDYILPLRRQELVPVIVVSAFDWATDKLEQLTACITSHPNPHEYARLLMSGELRANSALALTLDCLDCPARSLTGREAGIVTKGGAVDALIDRVDSQSLLELIAKEMVPVVAGFQGYYYNGQTERDEVSILGRGGSNLTAVAVAAALRQTEATMYSDVDGIYDADPKTADNAQRFTEVMAEDLLSWSQFPTVIQRESVEYAIEQGVDIWIRSGFEPDRPGTRIICRR